MINRDSLPTEQLMRQHVRHCLIFITVLSALFALFLFLQPGSAPVFTIGDDIGAAALEIVALLLALPLALPRSMGQSHPRVTGARLLLALSIGIFTVGQLIWVANQDVLHLASLFPSWADAGFLGALPLLLLGIQLLSRHPLSLVTRARVFADSTMILVGVVTFTWYFLLGPTLLQGGNSPLSRVVSATSPVCDLLLVMCLLLLAGNSGGSTPRRTVLPLTLGLVILTVANVVYGYQQLHHVYVTGTILDIGWPLGFLLIGLAVRTLYLPALPGYGMPVARHEPAVGCTDSQFSLWRALLPYGFIPVVGALIVSLQWVNSDARLARGVYVGGLALVAIVLLRQILARVENLQLSRQVHAQNRALTEMNARLEALATTDPLTALPNHRAMVAALDREFARARRYPCSFAVLFVDIDHFKRLNDRYGHASGDTALGEFAHVMSASVRSTDTVGRWGGEEFVILLPEVDAGTALMMAESVRLAVAGHRFTSLAATHLTSSIGVAVCPNHGDTRGVLLHAADRAMYVAKALGRNQVRTAEDPAVAMFGHDHPQDEGEREGERETTWFGIIEALAAIMDARDHATNAHAHAVAALAMRLAVILGLPAGQTRMIGAAGRLHDIGKVAVPDAILGKPARLTAAEWVVIRRHPAVGAEIVNCVPMLRAAGPMIHGHHERWDGGGYPDGDAGEAIPFGARIVAVADVYSALVEERPYRAAFTPDVAMGLVRQGAGTQSDPAVVAALARHLAIGTTGGQEAAKEPA